MKSKYIQLEIENMTESACRFGNCGAIENMAEGEVRVFYTLVVDFLDSPDNGSFIEKLYVIAIDDI